MKLSRKARRIVAATILAPPLIFSAKTMWGCHHLMHKRERLLQQSVVQRTLMAACRKLASENLTEKLQEVPEDGLPPVIRDLEPSTVYSNSDGVYLRYPFRNDIHCKKLFVDERVTWVLATGGEAPVRVFYHEEGITEPSDAPN